MSCKDDIYQLERALKLISNPILISEDGISAIITSALVKTSSKRGVENKVILFKENRVKIYNESSTKLIEVLTNINDNLTRKDITEGDICIQFSDFHL